MTSPSRLLPFSFPDRQALLVHDGLPWLAHTPLWAEFTPAEQRRANQLMGLLVNELFALLEQVLIGIGLAQAYRTKESADLRRLFADERRHKRWFLVYNRAFAPEVYPSAALRFVRPRRCDLALLHWSARIPLLRTVLTWLVLATESWSCAHADSLSRAARENPGHIDRACLALHHAHRKEELRHLVIGQALLAQEFRRYRPWVRAGIVRMAGTLHGWIMRPRRGAAAMIACFVDEFPRWHARRGELLRAVRAVGRNTHYWQQAGADTNVPQQVAATWGSAWPTLSRGDHA